MSGEFASFGAHVYGSCGQPTSQVWGKFSVSLRKGYCRRAETIPHMRHLMKKKEGGGCNAKQPTDSL